MAFFQRKIGTITTTSVATVQTQNIPVRPTHIQVSNREINEKRKVQQDQDYKIYSKNEKKVNLYTIIKI